MSSPRQERDEMSDAERRGFRRVFRLPFTRSRVERAVDDELRFHLEERIREFHERGMTREQAELEARRRFGDYDSYRREASTIDETTMRDRTRAEFLDTLRRELRHAATTLWRSPSFSLITCVTLALGLGAATTIFTLLDRVVLRPLPYPNAERMVHIGTLWPFVRQDAEFRISRAQFFYFKQNSATLSDLGLYDSEMLPIPGDGEHGTERVPTLYASASLFSVLGVAPERGRLFTAAEGVPRRRTVALISHGYWVRRYGGDPSIVGKRIFLGGEKDESFEIIGVLPPGANVPDFKADIWFPNWLDPAAEAQNNHTHSAIGVARPGVTIELVDADLKRVEREFEALWPGLGYKRMTERGFLVRATWLQRQLVGDKVTRALWILFGSVAVVLLIAAANVANLFLVRIDARRREVAVRTALGAGRQQLAVLFLGESLLLAAAAAVGAVVLSYLLLHVVLALAPQNLPRLEEVSLDWRGVTFCIAVALCAAVVFGLLPLGAATGDVKLLREGGRGLTTSRGHNIARRALVVSQVALAVVLFSGAALMVKSFARLKQVRPGFDPTGVVAMDVLLPYTRYQTYQRTATFWHQLSDRVDALPGVVGVGATDVLPLTGESGCTSVSTSGALHTEFKTACVPTIVVAPGYFEAMGMRVKGATPDWGSTEAMVGPVVLSKAFADQFYPNEDAVGHGIKINNNRFPDFRIVGVAEDVRANGLQKPPVNAVYFPLVPPVGAPGWDAGHYMSLVVRAPTMRAAQLAASVRAIVRELDPQVPVDNVQTMEVVVAKSMAQTSFTMLLLLISAAIALALSAVGIYGVISYVVSHRRAEIGIRMALGAQVSEVAQMVVSQSLALAIVGVGIGLVAALVGTRLMQSLLFEVRPNDPVVLMVTAIALLAIAGLASFAPARRAARVDPVEALRSS
jgi:putative ABC transport system permease protein